MKKWYCCELCKADWEKFRIFLKENGIRYEASGCYNLVHIEVYEDPREFEMSENFLYAL